MSEFNLDPETPPGNTSAGNVEEIASQIASESPEVQAHAVAAAMEKEEAAAPAAEGVKVDKAGVAFDASKHTGTMLKNGSWREKRSTLGKPRAAVKTAAQVQDIATSENKARAAAAVSVAMITGGMTQFFGGEWQPRTKAQAGYDERDFMIEATGDYFIAKGIQDIPPGAAFAMAMFGYFGSRFMMPETKQKVSRFRTWLALRIAKRALKKKLKQHGIVAIVEIRDGVLTVDGKPHSDLTPSKV